MNELILNRKQLQYEKKNKLSLLKQKSIKRYTTYFSIKSIKDVLFSLKKPIKGETSYLWWVEKRHKEIHA